MKFKAFGAAGGLLLLSTVLAAACSSSEDDPGTAGDAGVDGANTTDTSAADDSTAPAGECSTNEDCTAKLPATTPENCAVATCDTLQKKCRFKTKDADGDGHLAKNCTAATVTIETGDDCDDADPNTYPGAWDGPSNDQDSGPDAKTDRCDQKDNDCNGSADDGKFKVDGGDKTCKCDPDKPLPCYEYSNGTPIDASTLDGNNKPKGICKKGSRSCTNGIPGACVGAVGPQPYELCDSADNDCDGLSGNAGDTVPSAPIWYKDIDNDGHGDKNQSPKQQCLAPAAGWKQSITNDDCNDGSNTVYPGAFEYCGDGIDSNCANGDSENYGDLGAACTAGTYGICKRKGTMVCSGSKTSTVCNAVAGSPTGGTYAMSSDATIDLSQARAGYDPRWDYDCSNTVEVADTLYEGTFRAYACSGNYASACATLGTQAACNAGVFYAKWFNCESSGGFYLSGSQLCGHYWSYIGCGWQYNGGAGCEYIANTFKANNNLISCK